MIKRALEIAMKAHKGQTDKEGNPYIFHTSIKNLLKLLQ